MAVADVERVPSAHVYGEKPTLGFSKNVRLLWGGAETPR